MQAVQTVGQGDLPKVVVTSPDAASAEFYLSGGHVTSWQSAVGGERLFLSQKAVFRAGTAIRGGVPVIFPQFSGFGRLAKHGFARVMPWEYTGLVNDTARFILRDSDETRLIWDHVFELELGVRVSGKVLTLGLNVRNTGKAPFTFTAALHTYLRIRNDIESVIVEGLGGLHYRDSAAGDVERVQAEPELKISGEVDRIYLRALTPVTVSGMGQATRVEMTGFQDVVIWNPGPEKGAALSDLEPEGYRQMLCVEAGVINAPVELAPGSAWQGAQIITALA
jgi:glucose-6-phosphate 1-epimerase